MPLSISEVIQTLLRGQALSWVKFAAHKAGTIHLKTPEERRLLQFLLSNSAVKVAEANEELFDGLITAWKNSAFDPTTSGPGAKDVAADGTWRLMHLEASGFGGLNVVGGPIFDLWIGGENWCLEGQNGSGKTSIASAIIWAMTGFRIRDQDGIIHESGKRSFVHDEAGVSIGDWPALVSYPTTALQLKDVAECWVRLTFENEICETATAYRKLCAPPTGEPNIEVQVDPRLLTAPRLIETGLLMPARLSRIGFGEKGQSLYEAVKLLTGLDQLADIGEGAANFSNKAKRFLKYARDSGIQIHQEKVEQNLKRAKEKATEAEFDFGAFKSLDDQEYAEDLREKATSASDQARQHLDVLKSDMAPQLNTAEPDDRAKIKVAVTTARGLLQQGVKGIEVFEAWGALATAPNHPDFQKLPQALKDAKTKLTEAEDWDIRQSTDQKLRLKALASQFFVTSYHDHSVAECPLCENKLSGEKQKALTSELEELKKSAQSAERKLSDVCVSIEKIIRDYIPMELNKHFDLLVSMEPKGAFEAAALERFANDRPFADILIGMAGFTKTKVILLQEKLPSFQYSENTNDAVDAKPVANNLKTFIGSVERVVALVLWWSKNRQPFRDAWAELKGIQGEDGKWPLESLEGKLASLEASLEKAVPLDEASKALLMAAVDADEWWKIQNQQKIRQAIADALEPLKELRMLVEAETASSISALSGRLKTIIERIHLVERLSYGDVALSKKTVRVSGLFDQGICIDASLVANTSWLRAILWTFVLALREQTINSLGKNPFPLVILDDPQTTFDPRNKRKWAQEIARLANLYPQNIQGMQLVLTTHERQFFQYLVNIDKLVGQQGLVARLDKVSNVATVVNGSSLARSYDKALTSNDDEAGHKYVGDVRIYCEDLLKIMLRSEGPSIADNTIEKLVENLKNLRDGSISPFNRLPFKKLIDIFSSGGGGKAINLINESHHKYDGTIGLAQATEVRVFWEKTLQKQIHDCFNISTEFGAYSGESRIFPWMENVIELPAETREKVENLTLLHTGIAAAAKTDGRAGDGLITIEEWKSSKPIKLVNHEIYQLAAGTLAPVAGIGDLLIVSNYAKVHERNLVVTAFENKLLARRYNETDIHPHIVVLTGEAVDPYSLPQPIIAPKEKITPRKIVGTIFTSHFLPPPQIDNVREIITIPNFLEVEKILDGARLFQVSGRSAEPIALDTQFLITRTAPFDQYSLAKLEGRLIIAFDETGARYFKRFRNLGSIAILESLNPDGTAPPQVLSLDSKMEFPKITGFLEVVGVLFELP